MKLLVLKEKQIRIQKLCFGLQQYLQKKLFEEGIDNANQKIMKFSDETGKYMELLFPFAAVAFASYAIKGKDLDLKRFLKLLKIHLVLICRS